MNQKNTNETALFYAGWAILGFSLVLWLFYLIDPFKIGLKMLRLPCILNYITGLYCPGCGGTRAVISLFKGRFYQSFVYHPMVIYTAVICGWFMISQLIERVSKHKIKIGMKYRDIYLWIALVIVAINFVVKNALLFMGTDLLKLF